MVGGGELDEAGVAEGGMRYDEVGDWCEVE